MITIRFTRGCSRLALRGTGVELRVMASTPTKRKKLAPRVERGSAAAAQDFPHGWRDVIVVDPDGYVWAVGIPIGRERAPADGERRWPPRYPPWKWRKTAYHSAFARIASENVFV
jgi:hypothetical protein